MAEYLNNDLQLISLNSPVVFENSIPCPKGYVYHEDGTGIFILRGCTNNCFARYQITYNGNIAVPEEGELTSIALSIAVNGEERPTSRAIFTPQATEEFGNITSTALITVPKDCCFSVSVRYVDATVSDVTVEPTPAIEVVNSNLVITRIA